MTLETLPITDTRWFFRPVSAALVELLRTLPHDAWDRPTIAGTWRVRDVVAHLLDVTMRRLAFHRDRHKPPAPRRPVSSERDFVAFINELNAQWIGVAERISPRLLTDLLALTSSQLSDFAETFPLDGPAQFAVSWAGESKSAGWFDLGREFTELWHHQMQIRDAVGSPPLANPEWLRAFLFIAVRGLPHAYRHVSAAEGETLAIEVTGAAGATWTLRRDTDKWTIWSGQVPHPTAKAVLSDDAAWRLLFNALPPGLASAAIRIEGNQDLAAPLLRARSVIV